MNLCNGLSTRLLQVFKPVGLAQRRVELHQFIQSGEKVY